MFLFSFLFSYADIEDEIVKRVHSHLLIYDYSSALKECEEGLSSYPESEKIKKAYIKSLAANGKDDEAISIWKKMDFTSEDATLLEAVAWGVLKRLEYSSQLTLNSASLMGAYATDDVHAVKILLNQLNSTSAILRATAVQLAPRYRDNQLIDKLIQLLSTEKIWFVRLEVIKALGSMEVKEIKEPLKQLITHSRTTTEEKGVAIASLVTIYEDIEDKELGSLILSKRAGLRHLACQIVSHLDLKKRSAAIEKLLDDPTSDVRIAALNTLYLIGLKEVGSRGISKMFDLTEDPCPSVALTAAWGVSRLAPETTLQVVRKWIYSTDESSRRLAAYILGRMGKVGMTLSHEVIKITPDPFVKANLALGGIGQGGNSKRLADVLYAFLSIKKEKLMWDHSQSPFFQILSPSLICHTPQVAQYPTMVDQLTRLEILGMLAVLKHPHAEEGIKSFLRKQALGVTYAASTTLLEEGGEDAIEILRGLLHAEEEMIRIQAAVVLAFSGKETEAIQVLQEAYPLVDREMKVKILGALGYIGDKMSIPFLIGLLEEPYQVLKVMAASALIQCVYH